MEIILLAGKYNYYHINKSYLVVHWLNIYSYRHLNKYICTPINKQTKVIDKLEIHKNHIVGHLKILSF